MLNKLIICGIFILIIIYYFNQNLQESFLTSNQGDSVLKNLKNDFNDIYRKKQSGSSSHVTGILNTVSSHLQTLHTQQTIDLIKENSYTSDDNKSTQINFSNLNSEQVKKLDNIEHVERLHNAVNRSIEYNSKIPTTKNVLKGFFS